MLLRFCAAAAVLTLLPALPLLKNKPDAAEAPPPAAESAPLPEREDALPHYYRVLETDSGRILKVSPQEYLKGAAAAELPASFHAEMVTAQMVASHSYALTVLAGADPPVISDDPAKHQGYLTEEERRELYGDAFAERESALDSAAAEAVCWLLTTDGEELLPAVFHGCSAGMTESAENVWGNSVPCLVPVESPWDTDAPGYRQEFSFTMQEAERLLAESFPGESLTGGGVRVTEVSPSGTVLTAEAGGIFCTGQEIRRIFSLPSACFEAESDGETLRFDCRGRGHGVGMSQYGAEAMALSGCGWREILAHYYPGSILVKISLQDGGI